MDGCRQRRLLGFGAQGGGRIPDVTQDVVPLKRDQDLHRLVVAISQEIEPCSNITAGGERGGLPRPTEVPEVPRIEGTRGIGQKERCPLGAKLEACLVVFLKGAADQFAAADSRPSRGGDPLRLRSAAESECDVVICLGGYAACCRQHNRSEIRDH